MGQRRSNMKSDRRRRSRLLLMAVAISVVLVAAFAWRSLPEYRCIAVNGASGELTLNLDGLARGTSQKYCWRSSDGARTVRFIVARRSDDGVTVVLDACRVCYLNKLGYRISKGNLICRFCGNRYSIDNLSVGKMSCLPFKVPFRFDRGSLRIKTSALKADARFFPPEPVADRILNAALAWFARLDQTNSAIPVDAPQWAAKLSRTAASH